MATVPRKYITTYKGNLDNIDPKNGQIIGIYDSDEFCFDLSVSGSADPNADDVVRRKIHNIKVITSLPDSPEEDILYIYIGSEDNRRYLPDGVTPLYDLRVWVNNGWLIVGSNQDDTNVKTSVVTSSKFYLVGSSDVTTVQDTFSGDGSTTEFELSQVASSIISATVGGTTASATLSEDKTKVVFASAPASGTNNVLVIFYVSNISALYKTPSVYVENGVIHADLVGTVTNATNATNAEYADYAEFDTPVPGSGINPQRITTYIRGLSSDTTSGNLGSTITITKGDGTTSTIRTKDTTYSVFTSSAAGLVDKTTATQGNDSTLLLTGSGWMSKANITMPTATKADQDGLGQNIATNYIKSVSYNTSTELLTVTYGDDNTTTVSIPDTTYGRFTIGTDGLVKGPTSDDTGKYLNGSNNWVDLPVYPGADSANPVNGLVKAATSSQLSCFLKGDGSWGGTFTTGVDGLVPGPASGITSAYSLRADGTWAVCPDTKNTAGATNVNATQSQSALFLTGAANQGSNPQTYSDEYVYILNHKLYQYDAEASTPAPAQVVDVSSVQALTNKTYEGYTLGTACEATVASTVNLDTTVPTGNAVATYVGNQIQGLSDDVANKLDYSVIAPLYDDTSTSYVVNDCVMYEDGTGAKLYKCTAPITAPAGDFDSTKWSVTTVVALIQGT